MDDPNRKTVSVTNQCLLSDMGVVARGVLVGGWLCTEGLPTLRLWDCTVVLAVTVCGSRRWH